ncbi:MAG: heavy metal translocating P-type ATPase [Erysipelotrichaceae bacterium]
MKQYEVKGMSCASCCAHVEKAALSVKGVKSVSVSLLTNSMTVEGEFDQDKLSKAIDKAGYKLVIDNQQNSPEKDESDDLKVRLAISLVLWLILMYFSMGAMMFDFPLPAFFAHNHLAVGILELLLTIAIMIINKRFYISGFKGLLNGSSNMDSLVALSSCSAFIYSTVVLFMMSDAIVKGDSQLMMKYMDELYFESAATILTLISLGKMLESVSKRKTTDALRGLMDLSSKKAIVIKDGSEVKLDIGQVEVGDIMVVKPAEKIALDGTVIYGNSCVDESALTGESIPKDKFVGDKVYCGTINQSGYLQVQVTSSNDSTILAQMIDLVMHSANSKAKIAKTADRISAVFVPAVILIAVATIIVWLLVGQPFGYSLQRGISVLVISCPCSLGLATPVAVMVASGIAAKNGILFKDATSIEEAGKIDIVALDKTATITSGIPTVTDVICLNSVSEEELLTYCYSLESCSEHPLAKAICNYANQHNVKKKEITDFRIESGSGLSGYCDNHHLYGGNVNYLKTIAEIDDDTVSLIENLSKQGKTAMIFGSDDVIIGVIAVEDKIKEDSIKAINQLQDMGIKVVMITGDNENTAKAVCDKINIKDFYASVLPQGKQQVVNQLKKQGKVMMVGDGINDALALSSADIGVAVSSGSDIAIDSSDVVLMKNSLLDVPACIRLSKKALLNIKENLFWAFIYNIIGIPLAAGAFIKLFNWQLNPMFAAAAMSFSSVTVVCNALRLNLFDIYNNKNDKKRKRGRKETKEMEKVLTIEGMMCPNCQRHVQNALEKVDGVTSASADYQKKQAVITCNKEIDEKTLQNAIEQEGYKLVDIK